MILDVFNSGTGPPLVLLHGLFGSAGNLQLVTRAMSTEYSVYSLDLRNHGQSPHHSSMNYPLMAEDVANTLAALGLGKVKVLGHSMGGKVAMQLALSYPEQVEKLCVADIAPVAYAHHHQQIIEGLRQVSLATVNSRREAATVLAQYVDEPGVRGFLLKSLHRNSEGDWRWRFNLDAIESNYASIAAAVGGLAWPGPTLFLKGNDSNYITSDHAGSIFELFPHATFKSIAGAGHWLHAEKPATFNRLLGNFLSS
jgi:esterase